MTGVSAGLGQAFANMLLDEGVKVWGTAREVTRLSAFSKREGFTPVALDLEKAEDAVTAYTKAEASAGGFDLLVNNAGFGVFAPFASPDFSVWRTQLEAMLVTTAQLNHAAFGRMTAAGRGCIVNVASLATDFPLPYMTGYNVAKAGLSALSESLAWEARGTGVVVIDFRPGDFRTGFNREMRRPGGGTNSRLQKVWAVLEKNLSGAPSPEFAASGLRRALVRGRSGTVRCGQFFQARLAPFLVRFAPAGLRRMAMARYFGGS